VKAEEAAADETLARDPEAATTAPSTRLLPLFDFSMASRPRSNDATPARTTPRLKAGLAWDRIDELPMVALRSRRRA
jgi:hypothetical protein